MRTKQPLRIFMIGHSSWGGSGRIAVRLSNALARRGHDVVHATYGPVPWTLDARISMMELKPDAQPSFDLHAKWTADDTQAFRRLVEIGIHTQRSQIIHAHYAHPFAHIVAEAQIDEGLDPAKVMTLHGTDVDGLIRNDQRALTHFTKSTTVSTVMMDRTVDLEPPCSLIPNFIEDAWFSRNRPTKAAAPTIVHVSNHRQVKDPNLLVTILKWCASAV